jgi:arabinofuranan 3-O-arabinosyltransferase
MPRRLVRRASAATLRRASWLLIAVALLGIVASFVVRGGAAGADFEAYWVAARTWVDGGDPYDLPPDVLPYVYAPWGLPLFVPLALLPWDPAFTIWRVLIIAGLAGTLAWAARRRPMSTAAVFGALAIPIGVNLDTGNITLPLALLIFASRFAPRWVAGVTWGAATALKWATLPLAIVLGPVARRWGLLTIAAGIVLSLVLWPMTSDQLRTIAGLERPFPIDYLVLAWAAVPWLWTDPNRRRWLDVRRWPDRFLELIGRRRASPEAGSGSPAG